MNQQKIIRPPQKVSLGFRPSLRSFRLISPSPWKLLVLPPYGLTVLLLSLSLSLQFGCGAVGKPIPPEDVGIEAKKRKQERETGVNPDKSGMEDPLPATEQPEELPPLFPIGAR
ncbi:MAG: hypothetical protein AB7T38_15830 [Nitrospirales bacterium]